MFNVLIDHYIHELKHGPSFISLSKICEELNKKSIYIENPQIQISNIIYKIRLSIHKEVSKNCEIIISKKWKGYRLNNYVFLGRSDDFF